MSRNNTGNPIGSKAFPDFEDNVKNLDQAVNSDELSWSDRLGRDRKSFEGMEREFRADQADRESEFRTFIASSGYQFAGDYAAGIEITQYNQVIRDSNGEFWRVSGQVDLPYVTTGVGIPEGGALAPAGDAVLRQDLAAGSAFIDGDRSDRFVREAVSDVEITVGSGGDTDNLNAALIRAMKFRNSLSKTNARALRVTVRILSGTVISEQVLIERGIDMGHIEIISDDPTVLVDGSNMNRRTNIKIIYVDGSLLDLPAAFFFAAENSTLPIIGCLFDMQGVGPDAVVVAYNSSAYIRIGCGVINSGSRGIYALHGSHVVAHGTNFSGAGNNAVSIFRGSFVDFRTANGDDASGLGMYCGSNSRCEALDSSFRNAGSHGIEAYGASVVHARNVDVSGAGGYGLHSRDGSIISTRTPKINDTSMNGIYTLNGGTVLAPGAEIANCGNNGIRAIEGGRVLARGAMIDNPAGRGAWIARSEVDLSEAVISSAQGIGLEATSGSSVNFHSGVVSGGATTAIDLSDGVSLVARNANISSPGGIGIISRASTVNARGCEISSQGAGVSSLNGSRASLGESTITSSTGAAINANGASTVDADNSTLAGGSEAVFANRGSTININESAVSSGGSVDVRVVRGGVISAHGASGSLSQEANAITSSGIIFQ